LFREMVDVLQRYVIHKVDNTHCVLSTLCISGRVDASTSSKPTWLVYGKVYPVSCEKFAPPPKLPGGDFLTDGDRETFAPRRFIHDRRL